MARYRITIPDWHPTALNRLMKSHWRRAARLKAVDRDLIGAYRLIASVPRADGPRRVRLVITLASWREACDPDAYWKSTLDALVRHALLVDDDRRYCRLDPVVFRRGERRATTIELEDL